MVDGRVPQVKSDEQNRAEFIHMHLYVHRFLRKILFAIFEKSFLFLLIIQNLFCFETQHFVDRK